MTNPWACVIGKPIAHSLSPVLHTKAYDLLGLDWDYYRFEVSADDVPQFFAELPNECQGVSVTMPCKRAVLSQVDSVESMAKALKVANTVVSQGGLKAAFNTDVQGIEEAIRPLIEGAQDQGRPVVIGNGATACSALAALATLGHRNVVIAARNLAGSDGAFSTAQKLGIVAEGIPLRLTENVTTAINSAPIVVSTVPHAASAEIAARIDPGSNATLLDVTYSGDESPLEAAFVRSGARVASPLAMLVHQGIAQVKLMTNREVPFQPVFEAVVNAAGTKIAHS